LKRASSRPLLSEYTYLADNQILELMITEENKQKRPEPFLILLPLFGFFNDRLINETT
jgi:hypothetical protein